MNETKLLRCPFCGGEAFLHTVEPHKHIIVDLPDYGGGAFVECTNCSCAISGETAEEAAKAWNTRKPMEDIVDELEELLAQEIISENVVSDVGTGLSIAIAIIEKGGTE